MFSTVNHARFLAALALGLVCLAEMPAQAQPALVTAANTSNQPSQASAPSAAHRLGARDVMRLSVYDQPDLGRAAAESEIGTIRLPSIGVQRGLTVMRAGPGNDVARQSIELGDVLRENGVVQVPSPLY